MPIEFGELTRARNRVVGADVKRLTIGRRGFDAIRMDHASSRPHEVQAPLEFFATSECQHGI